MVINYYYYYYLIKFIFKKYKNKDFINELEIKYEFQSYSDY